MNAPFKIEKNTQGLRTNNDVFKDYLGRLLKLIPAEIVGLYMVGSGFIPQDQHVWSIIWPVICLIGLIILRIYGTKDLPTDAPQPVPVFIAAIAFIIWIYWLGGPFVTYDLHKPFIGSLLILVWSFVVPIFYEGS